MLDEHHGGSKDSKSSVPCGPMEPVFAWREAARDAEPLGNRGR